MTGTTSTTTIQNTTSNLHRASSVDKPTSTTTTAPHSASPNLDNSPEEIGVGPTLRSEIATTDTSSPTMTRRIVSDNSLSDRDNNGNDEDKNNDSQRNDIDTATTHVAVASSTATQGSSDQDVEKSTTTKRQRKSVTFGESHVRIITVNDDNDNQNSGNNKSKIDRLNRLQFHQHNKRQRMSSCTNDDEYSGSHDHHPNDRRIVELLRNSIKDDTQSPLKFLLQVMKFKHGIDLSVKSHQQKQQHKPQHESQTQSQESLYHVPTAAQLAGYTTRVVTAARNSDLPQLQRIFQEQQQREQQQQQQQQGNVDVGQSSSASPSSSSAVAGVCRVDAISQFGESLLHLACRRGYVEMVSFLVHTCHVPIRVVDDFGRNPVHDACWNPLPQLDICKTLIDIDPSLFLQADKRGFTPFDYSRPQHWSAWKQFLWDHQQCFVSTSK